MATKICPGCGARYHGKRCPECLYEPFGEARYTSAPHRDWKQPRETGSYRHSERNNHRKNPGALAAILFGLFFLWIILGLVFTLMQTTGQHVVSFASVSAEPEPLPLPEEYITLYDDGAIQVLLGWRDGPIQGDIPVYLINNSDRRIIACTDGVAVNGCMTDDVFFFCEAGRGSSSMSQLWIDMELLRRTGIHEVSQITLQLQIVDKDTYETLNRDQELLSFGPGGIVPAPDITGHPLLANKDVLLVFQGVEVDEYGLVYLRFYGENRTDTMLELSSSELIVNGENTGQYIYQQFFPDTQVILIWELYQAEALGIQVTEQLESLTFDLTLTRDENWEEQETVGISLTID